jgi:hypothetical protein
MLPASYLSALVTRTLIVWSVEECQRSPDRPPTLYLGSDCALAVIISLIDSVVGWGTTFLLNQHRVYDNEYLMLMGGEFHYRITIFITTKLLLFPPKFYYNVI